MASGLGGGRQRANPGQTHGLPLDWRWKGGVLVWVVQQLGQQDSSDKEVREILCGLGFGGRKKESSI